jgi:hypothetical protein
MGRPRKIIDPNALPFTAEEKAQPDGVIFINNHINRFFQTGTGRQFKFTNTRQIFTDKDEIKALREIAKDPNSAIFLFADEEPEPAPILATPPDPLPEPLPPEPTPAPAAQPFFTNPFSAPTVEPAAESPTEPA